MRGTQRDSLHSRAHEVCNHSEAALPWLDRRNKGARSEVNQVFDGLQLKLQLYVCYMLVSDDQYIYIYLM